MTDQNNNCWLKGDCSGIDCNHLCLRKYKLDYLYEQALFSITQRSHVDLYVDADGADKAAFISLQEISTHATEFIGQGNQLYLHSSIAGNGKTSWALRIVQQYFDALWPSTSLGCHALFISVPRFLLELKDNISQQSDYISHIKENILKADVVIWDDIATKNVTTPFEGEHLLSYIDNRIELGKCNIFTSNLNDQEMHEVLGDRLASRICNLSYNIEFKGADKRGL